MTSQELYEIVRREIDIRASVDPAFRYAQQRIDRGNGDFTDSAQCSRILAEILGEKLANHILELGVDGGRSELCQRLLKDHFNEISRNFEQVQAAQDKAKGLDLGTVKPAFPAERAKQVGDSLDDPTVSDATIQRRCQGAVTNVANSMHDSFIKENARFRNNLGLKPIIQRFGAGACAWCAAVAGKYRFGEQPDDIFRRHDNCQCTIIYDTQVLRGKKDENGKRTRTWEEINPKEIEENAFNPTTFTQEQARQFEAEQLRKQGLVRVGDGVRLLSNGLTNSGNGGRMIPMLEAENPYKNPKTPLKIDSVLQSKHIRGGKRYNDYMQAHKFEPSYLTISEEKAQELVDKFHGTGILKLNKNGMVIPSEIIIDNDEVVGFAVNNLTGAFQETTAFKIQYGANGTHIVPTYENQKRYYLERRNQNGLDWLLRQKS